MDLPHDSYISHASTLRKWYPWLACCHSKTHPSHCQSQSGGAHRPAYPTLFASRFVCRCPASQCRRCWNHGQNHLFGNHRWLWRAENITALCWRNGDAASSTHCVSWHSQCQRARRSEFQWPAIISCYPCKRAMEREFPGHGCRRTLRGSHHNKAWNAHHSPYIYRWSMALFGTIQHGISRESYHNSCWGRAIGCSSAPTPPL